MKQQLTIVLSAPSGTGKSTVIQRLLERNDSLQLSISHTTRTARGEEEHGTHYYFVTRPQFETMIAAGAFLEWAAVHDNYYGTSSEELRRIHAAGNHALLDIDVQGARAVKAADLPAVLVFLIPPSCVALEERLKGRATEDEQTVRRRLRASISEFPCYTMYDYVVVNDTVASACSDIEAIIQAELSRTRLHAPLAEKLIAEARSRWSQ